MYLIALPGKRPPEGIFCYESIKVVQYNNYLIGGETQGFLNYIFRLGGGGIICYELIKMCSVIFLSQWNVGGARKHYLIVVGTFSEVGGFGTAPPLGVQGKRRTYCTAALAA